MKTRKIFFHCITSLILVSMLAFMSCASPNSGPNDESSASAEADGLEAAAADTGATGDAATGGDAKKDDLADLTPSDVKPADAGASDATPKPDAATPVAANDNKAADDLGSLDALGVPGDKGATPTADAGTPPAGVENKGAATAEVAKAETGGAADEALGLPGDSALTPATAEPAAADVAAATSAPTEPLAANPVPTETSPTIPTSPADAMAAAPTEMAVNGDKETTKSETAEKKVGKVAQAPWSGTSKVPSIPSKAISRKGTALNRFYFARKGDSPSSVSELLYGNDGKAKELKSWNKGAWKPGKLIFYTSPVAADDADMRSFYQERNVAPEDYQVQKGDWLSRIAANKLGSASSWREIAVVNGMNSPDALEAGQKLAIYPSPLPPFTAPTDSAKAKVAQADLEEPKPATPAAASPTTPATAATTTPNPAVASATPSSAGMPGGGDGLGGPATGAPGETPANPEASAATANPEVANATPTPPLPGGDAAMRRPKKVKAEGLDIGKLVEQNMFFIIIGVGVAILMFALLAVNKRKNAKQADDFATEDAFSAKRRSK